MSDTTATDTSANPRRSGRRNIVVLLIAVLAAVGFTGLGAEAALADASVGNPNSSVTVPQGGQWTFSGTGFATGGGSVTVTIDSGTTVLATFNLDGSGNLTSPTCGTTTRVPIPVATTVGNHTLYFKQGGSTVATSPTINVTATTATVTFAATGHAGASITVSGSGWPASSTLTPKIDGCNAVSGSITTNASGAIVSGSYFVIPSGTSLGTHLITFLTAGTSVSKNITVN